MEALNLPNYPFKIKSIKGRKQIFDPIRKRWLVLTPEEWVRQHFVQFLIQEFTYPSSLIGIEARLSLYKTEKRADIVVHDKAGAPWMVVECKRTKVKIDQAVFDQAFRYNLELKAAYIVVTNGLDTYVAKTNFEAGTYNLLQSFPGYLE